MPRRRWLTLLRDTRGESETIEWVFSIVPLWFMLVIVLVVVVQGLKLAGTASEAHLAARRAGTATLAAGQSMAQTRGAAWNIPGEAAVFTVDDRLIDVRWAYTWDTQQGVLPAALRRLGVGVAGATRNEGFYAGPGE